MLSQHFLEAIEYTSVLSSPDLHGSHHHIRRKGRGRGYHAGTAACRYMEHRPLLPASFYEEMRHLGKHPNTLVNLNLVLTQILTVIGSVCLRSHSSQMKEIVSAHLLGSQRSDPCKGHLQKH